VVTAFTTCSRDKKCAVIQFLWTWIEGVKDMKIHSRLTSHYADTVLPQPRMHKWIGMFRNSEQVSLPKTIRVPIHIDFRKEHWTISSWNTFKSALEQTDLRPEIWLRYEDDIFAIWPYAESNLITFLIHLNIL
jgi:hypothetical protein